MKKIIFALLAVLTVFTGCKKDEAAPSVTSVLEDIPTIQGFLDEAVPQADVDKIVKAGINAQSSINKQPWHFSVVTNKDVLADLSSQMAMPGAGKSGAPAGMTLPAGMAAPDGAPAGAPDGATAPAAAAPAATAPAAVATTGPKAGMGDAPLVIIISAKDGSDLDAGLATEIMSAEATVLGYGTKILTSPTMALNGTNKAEFQKLLGIPEDMSVKAVLLVGKYDAKLDGVTGATTRNAESEVVTYIK